VRPGGTLRVVLALPEGWHLTEGAPSVARLEGAGEPVEVVLTSTHLDLSIPSGASRLTLRLLWYACQDEGSCRVRSATYTIPLEVAEGGAERIEVRDPLE
jgi:hypothetical protein